MCTYLFSQCWDFFSKSDYMVKQTKFMPFFFPFPFLCCKYLSFLHAILFFLCLYMKCLEHYFKCLNLNFLFKIASINMYLIHISFVLFLQMGFFLLWIYILVFYLVSPLLSLPNPDFYPWSHFTPLWHRRPLLTSPHRSSKKSAMSHTSGISRISRQILVISIVKCC